MREQVSDPAARRIPEPAASLIRSISQAKRAAARMYQAWLVRAPDAERRQALADMAQDEIRHARALDSLVGLVTLSAPISLGAPIRDGAADPPGAHPWASAVLVAFILDQAATACLAALSHASTRSLRAIASSIVEDEAQHQRFVLEVLRDLARENAACGPRLATEMFVARDWVRQVFPRRAALAGLVEVGQLPRDATDVHDSFMLCLSDRVQEALGVLET